LEDQGVGGKMGSEWILGRLAWGVWIGFDWLRTKIGGSNTVYCNTIFAICIQSIFIIFTEMVGIPKERDHLEDQGVGGKMGSEWILGRLAWRVRIGFDWLRTGTGGGLL
jgi:hypothetical protein